MDGHRDTSPHPPGLAAIPELDAFDRAVVDTLPIWAAPVPDPLPAILVVDDEVHVGWIVRRLLQDLAPGYDILTSTDPVEALARIRGRTVPLIITDFSMPAMSGIDLATAIKGRAPETQVLLITAYPSLALEQQALHQGIEYYLSKPFAFADLARIVDTALPRGERPRQRPPHRP